MQRHTQTMRDCIAAVVAAILICPFILGSVSGRAPELAGGPPDAGTLLEEETVPDRNAPAGDGSPPKQTQNDFKTAQAKQADKIPAAQPAGKPQMPTREHEVQARSDQQESQPPQQVTQSTSTPPIGTNPPSLQAESSPKPTAVEQQPKPVAQMTPEEIQRAVAEYRTWVYKGKIRLILEHSQVTPEQLNSVTSLYVLTQVDRSGKPVQEELIDSTGHFRDDLRGTLADDILTGDLRSDEQWPSLLTQKAHSAFGPQYLAWAKFYLSDACALRIYRVLAQAVQDRTVQPATEFVMQLRPDELGHVGVVLLRPNFARERTLQP